MQVSILTDVCDGENIKHIICVNKIYRKKMQTLFSLMWILILKSFFSQNKINATIWLQKKNLLQTAKHANLTLCGMLGNKDIGQIFFLLLVFRLLYSGI